MRRVLHSPGLPWAWPDALAIGWGLWFAIVAVRGGHLPVPWSWYTDRSPALAVAGVLLIAPTLVWIERGQRWSSAVPEDEQRKRALRRGFLMPAQQSYRAIPAVPDSDRVRLGLLVDWPEYSSLAVLFWRARVSGVAAPVRPLARMVRVDEGVIEFLLLPGGDRVIMAGGFVDRTPTGGQYELAVRILVDYQDLHGEPPWFPGFDRAALLRQQPERPNDANPAE